MFVNIRNDIIDKCFVLRENKVVFDLIFCEVYSFLKVVYIMFY